MESRWCSVHAKVVLQSAIQPTAQSSPSVNNLNSWIARIAVSYFSIRWRPSRLIVEVLSSAWWRIGMRSCSGRCSPPAWVHGQTSGTSLMIRAQPYLLSLRKMFNHQLRRISSWRLIWTGHLFHPLERYSRRFRRWRRLSQVSEVSKTSLKPTVVKYRCNLMRSMRSCLASSMSVPTSTSTHRT